MPLNLRCRRVALIGKESEYGNNLLRHVHTFSICCLYCQLPVNNLLSTHGNATNRTFQAPSTRVGGRTVLDLTPLDAYQLERLPATLVALLGRFRLTLHGNAVPVAYGSKTESLLSCLALVYPQPVPRPYLLDLLWPESDPAFAVQSLNSLTHRLNKLSSATLHGAALIAHEEGTYSFHTASGIGVDIAYFENWSYRGTHLLESGDEATGLDYCERALALYQGDLYGDPSINTMIERERLRAAFLTLLARVADFHYRHDRPAESLRYVHRLLHHDPCREDAHRQAMRCYMRLGQRAQALRQYHICGQALANEYDAAPEPLTEALYDQLRLHPTSI